MKGSYVIRKRTLTTKVYPLYIDSEYCLVARSRHRAQDRFFARGGAGDLALVVTAGVEEAALDQAAEGEDVFIVPLPNCMNRYKGVAGQC